MSEEIKTEEAGTDNNQEEKKQKKSIVTSFMDGAKEGFYIGIENILPAMVLGYVIIRFLELTGLVNLIGKVFAPVMGIFGLPGEAAIVLMSAFLQKRRERLRRRIYMRPEQLMRLRQRFWLYPVC